MTQSKLHEILRHAYEGELMNADKAEIKLNRSDTLWEQNTGVCTREQAWALRSFW